MKTLLTSKSLLRALSVTHPVLFAVFPILFLYVHNRSEVSAGQLFKSIMLAVLGVLLLWLVLRLLLRNTFKAGLATTVFVILFFSYGRVYDFLLKSDVPAANHAYLLPAVLFVWGCSVYFIYIARREFWNATRILSVAAVTLILLNLTTVACQEVGKKTSFSITDFDLQDAVMAADNLSTLDAKPDIYYIVLDEYASPSTMLDYYDYDNSWFVGGLADRGFSIASSSATATEYTQRSIASTLSMSYLFETVPDHVCYEVLADSAVVNNLKSIGYQYVYFGSWFKYEVNADVYYNFYESYDPSATVNDFPRILWNTTMLRPFYNPFAGTPSEGQQYRSAIVDTLECLKTMPDLDGPNFVFAHIMCPHTPFVFGPNGEYVDPVNWHNTEDKKYYLGQYEFISTQIADVVAALLEKSNSPPIIILQSDHGPRTRVSGWVGLGANEWKKILNAYYLPGDGKNDLHDSISPVNTFRMIFNHYFGGDYEILPD